MPTQFFTETVDGSGAVHGQVSLAMGNGNLPKIAYTTTSGAVMLAERGANEWVLSTLPGAAAARDEYRISLAVDAASEPHVAFVSPATDRLIYGVRRTEWEFEEVPTEGGLFPGSVRFPAMKLYRGIFEEDPAFKDAPHLCYQAGLSLHHAAKLRRRDNPGAKPVWRKNVETVDGGGLAETGWFATLDFDEQDTLRIAYFDDLSPAGRSVRRLRLATMTPGLDFPGQPNSWQVDVLDDGEILGELPAMAHSITGEGVISYFERKARALKLCFFGDMPGLPAVEVVSGDVDGDGVRSSVGVSHLSKVVVAYGSGGRLRFATRAGPGEFTVDDVDAGGGWPSLVVDSDGNTHVAHVADGTLTYGIAPQSDE
jgi:hypothetical protein